MRGEVGTAPWVIAARTLLGRAIVVLLLTAACALAVGCRADASDVIHPAVGRWGVVTQSGQLIEAIEIRADRTYCVLKSAGIGACQGDGRFVVIDESRLRAGDNTGPNGTSLEFVVAGAELTLKYGDSSVSGFRRMRDR